MLKQGEEVKVMIIESDKDRERVSLGIKQLVMNPWDDIEKKYPVGEKISGKVVNLVPYGAFVELEEGVEGLIHVTEMSWTKRINKPQEVLRIGEEVEAVILDSEGREEDILGMKQFEPNPWEEAAINYRPGSRVQGKSAILPLMVLLLNWKRELTEWYTSSTCHGLARSTILVK